MKAQFLRIILTILASIALPLFAAEDGPAELTKLTEGYESRLAADLKPLVASFGKALKRLEKKLIEDGKLEMGLAVREYGVKVRLDGSTEVPAGSPSELTELNGVFQTARQEKIAPVTSIYVKALERLEKDLLKEDRLRDAVAVKQVRSTVQAAVPKPSKRSGNSPGEAGGEESADLKELREESILWWGFEKTRKDSVTDQSPAKNDGQLIGVQIIDDPERGKVASFKTRTGQIRLEHFKKFGEGSITIAAWVKCDTMTAGLLSYSTITETNEFLLIYDKGLRFIRENVAVPAPNQPDAAKWTHLAVTYDGKNARTIVYIDGDPKVDRKIGTGPIKDGRGIFVVGQDQDAFGAGFDPAQAFLGSIDDISIFPRVLKRVELSTLYRGQKSD